ncbi:hypothetical protein MKQ68_05730 [Chitinophaga horti]|uniref:DUF302 domain-containing protein n=1 Tax=Chitinophaga horti TaxID=2920382 RepID=A0ABY6J4I9_9BACT|nr:hypothetical protein [Chitinophaga horti]UYQ94590.1 hypothetical protein MKQ68_05730 [Chitinophaga horti]
MQLRLIVCILALAFCLPAMAQNTQPAYHHNKIAILPFHMEIMLQSVRDTSAEARFRLEVEKGIQCQQRMHDILTEDEDRLLVEIQDIEKTNELLQKAGIDLRKVTFMDPAKISRILGVDAILTCDIRDRLVQRFQGSPRYHPMTPQQDGLYLPTGHLHVQFFDGKSGKKIWKFEDLNNAFNWRKPKQIDKVMTRSFEHVRSEFPYTKL